MGFIQHNSMDLVNLEWNNLIGIKLQMRRAFGSYSQYKSIWCKSKEWTMF